MLKIDNRKRNIEVRKSNFLDKSNLHHNNKYDYSLVNYINNNTKIDIICEKHGVFAQTPSNHIGRYGGCQECKKEVYIASYSKGLEDFLHTSNNIHNYFYTYIKKSYINLKSKVSIICTKHGLFEQNAFRHKNGAKCPKCDIEVRANNQKLSNGDAINKLIRVHNNRYDYSKVIYDNYLSKVEIICKEHGSFMQRYDCHIKGSGCPICSESKGERKIAYYLEYNNIDYIREHSFNDCKNINKLSFDFYLLERNICIEFDGIQHFKSIDYFGGTDRFEYMKKCDNIKNLYCEKNNIKLIRISYLEYNKILEILKTLL